jgi:hypothetical protein
VTFAHEFEPAGDIASPQASAGEIAAGRGAWPLPTRWVDHLVLDSARTTWVYWASVALILSGLFVTRLLPCVDYPQHLALSDVARRLADPHAPEHEQFQLNYFTYNGLFHVLVAALSTRLPIELVGRVVLSVSLLGIAGAVIALVRVLRRPAVHALLFVPILFSFPVGWGFVNYVLATAIAAWTLVLVARVAARPTALAVIAIAALGLACAFAHVLAMLILCLFAAALATEVAWRAEADTKDRLWRTVRVIARMAAAGAPLVLGCIYCVQVYEHQYPWDPKMYRDSAIEGSNSPPWEKIVYFGAFATGLYRDGTDQIILWGALFIMGWAGMLAWKRRRVWDQAKEGTPPVLAPLGAMTLAYFVTPMVLIGTHLIFPRLSQWAVIGGVLATPRILETAKATAARAWMVRLSLAAGVNTLLHCAIFGWETNDASRLLDDLPAQRAATAVIWDPDTLTYRNGPLTHLAAYYAARKHGLWAFAFARYLSVPVRFKPNSQPPWPARGWEFSAEDYDPRCKYARAFPLVIVKAPDEVTRDASGEATVRRLVFKQDAGAVRLLSHHGRYWAFDSVGLPDDGTY